jgi:hypothetical protein
LAACSSTNAAHGRGDGPRPIGPGSVARQHPAFDGSGLADPQGSHGDAPGAPARSISTASRAPSTRPTPMGTPSRGNRVFRRNDRREMRGGRRRRR